MPKIHIPAIGYRQGGRQMLVTAMSPTDLVRMVRKPEAWDPVKTSQHGNRPRDKAHLQGIVKYLEEEEHFVLGAAVLYLTEREAEFKPMQIEGVSTDKDAASMGTLAVDIGALFDIGDGQHRIGAYEHIVQSRDEDGDPVIERLREGGQPLIIVIEDDPRRRAQDFADLQRNVKAPTQSLGQSMDRRQPINRELNNLFDDVPVLVDRVEYQKDNPGKLSAKLFSFKTVRYVSGLLLVGNAYRSPSTMDRAVNGRFEGSDAEPETARQELVDFWTALGELTLFADVLDDSVKAYELRQDTYLLSAGVLYAVAMAVYLSKQDGLSVTEAVRSMDSFNFSRTKKVKEITAADTPFAGNLIDSETGKLVAGRTAWETAAEILRAHVAKEHEANTANAQ
ncbi:DNA sulfur modification protein DndB [Streptomyces sp. NPDC102405]|uniref:DNA sulfur modification protein DndB n=1 Tax=Streptomyces sp. NPDC102405 TaxID=3366170 RepID=UPI00380EA56E